METTDKVGAPIHVWRVRLNGFRRFESLDFWPTKLNVIVGVNGAGKSSLLQGIAIGLSRLTSRIISGKSGGLQIAFDDIRIDNNLATVAVVVESNGTRYDQVVSKVRKGRKPFQIVDEPVEKRYLDSANATLPFGRLADSYRNCLTENSKYSVPVIAIYPVNRAVTDIPARIRGRHVFDQVNAYDGAFESRRNFRAFFEWFREREDLENEKRIEISDYRDGQLQAVRLAIEQLMPGYRNLRVRRLPLRMTLLKDDGELLVSQLSDGEKVLLSLAGDLARRLAIANPDVEDPLTGEGVVLIDEIDLHLHPQWQRKAVALLPVIFPNIQFFMTTHSPVIAGCVRSENLWLLNNGQISNAEAYGQDVGLVLSEIFDTPPRMEVIRNELDDLFQAINDDHLEDAQTRLSSLESSIGVSDPELVRARTLLRGYQSL